VASDNALAIGVVAYAVVATAIFALLSSGSAAVEVDDEAIPPYGAALLAVLWGPLALGFAAAVMLDAIVDGLDGDGE
jgi:hypothetical protein